SGAGAAAYGRAIAGGWPAALMVDAPPAGHQIPLAGTRQQSDNTRGGTARMKRAGVVITIIVAVLALGCGFGSAAAVIGVTQPSVAGSKTVVQFSVESGDSTATVAQRL